MLPTYSMHVYHNEYLEWVKYLATFIREYFHVSVSIATVVESDIFLPMLNKP